MENVVIIMVMLARVIMTLLVFARTSATGKSNLFRLMMIGLVAITAAGYIIVKPHFWVMMTMLLGMAALFHILQWRQKKLIDAGTINATCAKKDIHIALNVAICCFLIIFGILKMDTHVLAAWIAIFLGTSQIVAFIWWNVKKI